jgi:hypothetical protein
VRGGILIRSLRHLRGESCYINLDADTVVHVLSDVLPLENHYKRLVSDLADLIIVAHANEMTCWDNTRNKHHHQRPHHERKQFHPETDRLLFHVPFTIPFENPKDTTKLNYMTCRPPFSSSLSAAAFNCRSKKNSKRMSRYRYSCKRIDDTANRTGFG